jgi:hypothetical protein
LNVRKRVMTTRHGKQKRMPPEIRKTGVAPRAGESKGEMF